VGGTWGSSSALVAAALGREIGDGVLVVVLPHGADAEVFCDDLALFSALPVAHLPALEAFAVGDDAPPADDPATAGRLAVVKRLSGPAAERPRIIVTSIQALLPPLADPREVEASTRRLARGGRLDPEELATWLAARGWQATDAIEGPGCFARRGGILDLFAADWERPVRVEFDDDEIESLRTFDTVSQRSVATLEAIDLTALETAGPGGVRRTPLPDLLPSGACWALVEPGAVAEEARRLHDRLDVGGEPVRSPTVEAHPTADERMPRGGGGDGRPQPLETERPLDFALEEEGHRMRRPGIREHQVLESRQRCRGGGFEGGGSSIAHGVSTLPRRPVGHESRQKPRSGGWPPPTHDRRFDCPVPEIILPEIQGAALRRGSVDVCHGWALPRRGAATIQISLGRPRVVARRSFPRGLTARDTSGRRAPAFFPPRALAAWMSVAAGENVETNFTHPMESSAS